MSERTARRGRPSGLRLNPDAFTALAGDRSSLSIAEGASVSPAHLSEMRSGKKGVTEDVVNRIASFLDVPPGALFPELVVLPPIDGKRPRFVVAYADVVNGEVW
jgi:transcriptional regulator with XRE-family HTH domain